LNEFTVNSIFDLMHPDDYERVRNFVYQNISEKKKTFTCEFRIRSKNGEYYWREDLANVIYDEEGNYSKYIITSRDINERKNIESQLVESEQQLRLITENTSDGVAVIEEGRLTYVSPSYCLLLGYNKNEYLQFSMQDIFDKIHPEDVDRVRTLIYTSLEQGVREIKYEQRFMGADGVYHWREDSANIIYDENGKYTKYIVVTRDISERKETEKEKNRLYKITENQNEKLINFTHIVSHDIRSHTSNLSMILDLYEETDDRNEQSEYFNMLKQSTNKLSETIFYLNETVAIQSGIKNEKTSLNLKKEIEKALTGINAIVLTNNASITIDVDSDIEIFATQSYLESIIFNLLTNAIKYRSPERNPEIKITAAKIEDEVKFSITDNGIGIDLKKNKDKIFGMYKTFHGNTDAVGLGLFMIKNHLESMGGRIEVESQVNVGTTFNLYFI
jgi:PAS domain S-box-containing protein